jgi:hypothetical protein
LTWRIAFGGVPFPRDTRLYNSNIFTTLPTGSSLFCNIGRWRIVDSAALRTNRGDKSRLACGPERVVKRAQPLAVGSAVSSHTSDKQFDYSLVIGQAKGALCRISPQRYVDMTIYRADRLALVCALGRHVFQYRQASSFAILIFLGCTVSRFAASWPPRKSVSDQFSAAPFVGREHRRMAG